VCESSSGKFLLWKNLDLEIFTALEIFISLEKIVDKKN